MTDLTVKQLASLREEHLSIGDDLILSDNATQEIQQRMGNSLSNNQKRQQFAKLMTELATDELTKPKVQKYQTCIGKSTTQRYIQGIAKDVPLTKVVSIRTADKGLLRKKICTQKQIDQTGVYHSFIYPKPEKVTLTKVQAVNKVLSDYAITKAEFDDMKEVKYHVVAH